MNCLNWSSVYWNHFNDIYDRQRRCKNKKKFYKKIRLLINWLCLCKIWRSILKECDEWHVTDEKTFGVWELFHLRDILQMQEQIFLHKHSNTCLSNIQTHVNCTCWFNVIVSLFEYNIQKWWLIICIATILFSLVGNFYSK